MVDDGMWASAQAMLDADGANSVTRGDPEILTVSPANIGANDKAVFLQLVRQGGKVNEATLPDLFRRALCIGIAQKDGEIVGVGAIKTPYDGYRSSVFEKAKSKLDVSNYPFELGWFFVRESARGRGISKKLLDKLLPMLEGKGCYSTSDVTNDRMHKTLRGAGFKTDGVPYPSQLNAPDLQLFVRKQ
jgi:GNAT superfamily N-acetyltransferase